MKSYTFLFWAYAVVWVGIAGYLLAVFARIRRVDRRLDTLERELAQRRGQQTGS